MATAGPAPRINVTPTRSSIEEDEMESQRTPMLQKIRSTLCVLHGEKVMAIWNGLLTVIALSLALWLLFFFLRPYVETELELNAKERAAHEHFRRKNYKKFANHSKHEITGIGIHSISIVEPLSSLIKEKLMKGHGVCHPAVHVSLFSLCNNCSKDWTNLEVDDCAENVTSLSLIGVFSAKEVAHIFSIFAQATYLSLEGHIMCSHEDADEVIDIFNGLPKLSLIKVSGKEICEPLNKSVNQFMEQRTEFLKLGLKQKEKYKENFSEMISRNQGSNHWERIFKRAQSSSTFKPE